jgi:hypothetical protein
VPDMPSKIPVQGGKPMSVSQTVNQWAEHLVEQAKGKAAKKIGVDKPVEGQTIGQAFGSAVKAGTDDDLLDSLADQDLGPLEEMGSDKMLNRPMPRTDRHAYGESPREDDDDVVSDFFFTQSDKEAQSRRASGKRAQGKTQQRVDPTSTAKFRELERVAYSTRSFQINRYVAPPGMENVVKRLKGKKDVENPYAVAWSMYDRDKHTQDRSIGGLTRIGVLEGALQRSLRVLDAVSDGHYGVDKTVIERLHDDALEDLDRSFERDDPLKEAWKHVVSQARLDALKSVSRHSEQGPAAVASIEDREPEFPRDVMLAEMTGKGKGVKKKTEDYRASWLSRK